ncbi:MAG: PucR family transcriptional regulator [Solirubrobacteraceae bacterium]
MSDDARDNAKSLEEIRADIIGRLRLRRSEIEQAIHARIQDAVPNPVDGEDPEYQAGVLAAIREVLNYSLEGIKRGPEWLGPIPPAAAAQARRAACADVSLGTILRRYVAGHGGLGEFIAEEAECSGLSSHGSVLHHLRRTQEALLEHLTATIEHEYIQEQERVASSPEQRRMETVRKLLSGETVAPAELAELDYEFHTSWHLGVIATGAGAERALRGLEISLGCKLMPVSRGEGTVWAWFGGQRKLAVTDIERLLSANGTVGVSLAIGEPGKGVSGWRDTHQEAQVALLVALRKPQRLTRCADVLLEAAMAQNEALAGLLVKTYISPLTNLRKDGQPARETLRAYFAHDRNVSCTAGALKVVRRTVENRLHEVEQILGRPLHTCLAGLEIALRLEELGHATSADNR